MRKFPTLLLTTIAVLLLPVSVNAEEQEVMLGDTVFWISDASIPIFGTVDLASCEGTYRPSLNFPSGCMQKYNCKSDCSVCYARQVSSSYCQEGGSLLPPPPPVTPPPVVPPVSGACSFPTKPTKTSCTAVKDAFYVGTCKNAFAVIDCLDACKVVYGDACFDKVTTPTPPQPPQPLPPNCLKKDYDFIGGFLSGKPVFDKVCVQCESGFALTKDKECKLSCDPGYEPDSTGKTCTPLPINIILSIPSEELGGVTNAELASSYCILDGQCSSDGECVSLKQAGRVYDNVDDFRDALSFKPISLASLIITDPLSLIGKIKLSEQLNNAAFKHYLQVTGKGYDASLLKDGGVCVEGEVAKNAFEKFALDTGLSTSMLIIIGVVIGALLLFGSGKR